MTSIYAWILLSASSVCQEQTSAKGRRWAVLIGVEQYEDARVSPLRYCVDDAKLLQQTLISSCGYAASDVLLMVTGAADADQLPTKDNLTTWLRFFLKRVQPNDTVLIFFSGHGVLDQSGASWLLPSDTDVLHIDETALSAADFRKLLANCPAKEKLLLLDCCHSGGKSLVVETAPLSNPGAEKIGMEFRDVANLLTLASCKANETSYEWGAKQHGLFTHFLVRGLKGDADVISDGVVNTAELYSFVRDNVASVANTELKVKQTPVQIVPPGEVPVFGIATVEKKGFFSDFSRDKPGLLPEGWQGRGPTVQILGEQHVLQMRDIGTGNVMLPRQKTQRDFFLECSFSTSGYVNRPRSIGVTMEDRNRRAVIQVNVLDRYPNLDVSVNGRSIRGQPLGGPNPHKLTLERSGESLQVKLDGTSIQALRIATVPLPVVRMSLQNDRDEYGRADTSKFPTIYSVRIGPIED